MLMHLAIALVTYNALSGWLPLDHQHDGLNTQRLELRAPEVCADSARSAQGQYPGLGWERRSVSTLATTRNVTRTAPPTSAAN